MTKNIIFLDRDGTLIHEPEDKQVDSIEKLTFIPGVIDALQTLRDKGYQFIMVTNQNGIGSPTFPTETFEIPHQAMMDRFTEADITFEEVRVCPHFAADNCGCRKPKTGLVQKYMDDPTFDIASCYFIGDRDTDVELADIMGCTGIKLGGEGYETWTKIVEGILNDWD